MQTKLKKPHFMVAAHLLKIKQEYIKAHTTDAGFIFKKAGTDLKHGKWINEVKRKALAAGWRVMKSPKLFNVDLQLFESPDKLMKMTIELYYGNIDRAMLTIVEN
jgi:hypothetical protein